MLLELFKELVNEQMSGKKLNHKLTRGIKNADLL